MASKSFEFDGRQYRFARTGNEYTVTRDDGLIAWDVYPTIVLEGYPLAYQSYRAYKPAFATIAEAKAALQGERPATYYHELVFAETAYQAQRIREQMDADAARAKGLPA